MTNKTTTPAQTPAIGEIKALAPAEPTLDTNVRTLVAPTITPEFVQSIKDYGILQPILAVDTADGIKVRDGQRRTLGAIKAGLDLIPVYVIATDGNADAAAAEIRRISEQWITEDQRSPYTAADKARAAEQLSLAGLSPAKISKVTKAKRADIDAALAVAKAPNTLDTIADRNLTLDQAATLASWDHDPHVQKQLLDALATGQFEHLAQQWEDTRAEHAALNATIHQLATEGYTVLSERPPYHDADRTALDRLFTAERTRASTVDGLLEGLPHDNVFAFVYIDSEEETFWDGDQQVNDEDIDWDLADADPNHRIEPAAGKRDPRTLDKRTTYHTEIDWYISNHANLGLFTGSELPHQSRTITVRDTTNDGPDHPDASTNADAGDDAHTEHAKRVAAAEKARADAEAQRKHAQRQVRVLNKHALAAQKVRRDKITTALARKTLPKGKAADVAAFLATSLWKHHTLLAQNAQDANAAKITTELLGADPLASLNNASAERRQIINLAIVLGAHEANLPKDAWRTDPYEYSRLNRDARSLYLQFLVDVLGYTLSDIEHVITGGKAADDIPLD